MVQAVQVTSTHLSTKSTALRGLCDRDHFLDCIDLKEEELNIKIWENTQF